jgi:hypothetical protein
VRALLVGAPVLGALAAALAATGGLYFQRLNRREAYRKDAAKAIESRRGITRRLERFAYQERPDAAEIESVRQDWETLIRNEPPGSPRRSRRRRSGVMDVGLRSRSMMRWSGFAERARPRRTANATMHAASSAAWRATSAAR